MRRPSELKGGTIGLLALIVLLAAGATLLSAQTAPEPTTTPIVTSRTVELFYNGQSVSVPVLAGKVELVPVMTLLGAEAARSPAAGTWGVATEDHLIQLSPGHQYVLIDGRLQEFQEKPVATATGIAASLRFLERALLGPLGYHLEQIPQGYLIAAGSRFADPVVVRAAAADFAATTTLVLTLDRSTPATVDADADADADGHAVIQFHDGAPQLDQSLPLRSQRIRRLATDGQSLLVQLEPGIGLLSWHSLENPPRVILELGQVQPTPTPAPTAVKPGVTNPPIVIDPGHGGDDTGAVAPSGIMEKELSLIIARQLARQLRSHGHTVRQTRNSDEFRALTDRTALANRLQAKVFISLHANSSTVASVRGSETYYMSLDQSATDEAAAATAEIENRVSPQGTDRSPLELILWDLAQADVLNDSARLALAIQTRLNTLFGLRDRGVKQAPFTVLTGASMPSVLVEVGFLSNSREAALLEDQAHQQRLAEAIALGIEEFLAQQDRQ